MPDVTVFGRTWKWLGGGSKTASRLLEHDLLVQNKLCLTVQMSPNEWAVYTPREE